MAVEALLIIFLFFPLEARSPDNTLLATAEEKEQLIRCFHADGFDEEAEDLGDWVW